MDPLLYSLRTGSWRSKRWANIRREAPGNRSLHAFSQIANASHAEIILLTVKFQPNNLINARKPLEQPLVSFAPFWFLSIPEVKTKITSWIIIILQSPLCVQNLDADIGDWGECVQTPIAGRFAPNVCSALAPPGACSQATVNWFAESDEIC